LKDVGKWILAGERRLLSTEEGHFSFDRDEMMLVGGTPAAGGKAKPEARCARPSAPTSGDHPGAPPG